MMFANTLDDLDQRSGHMGDECFRYGSTWGCQPDCPIFARGECELQKENEEMFLENGELYDGT